MSHHHQCNPITQAPGSSITPPCEYLKLLEASADMLEQTTGSICELLALFDDIEQSHHADLVANAMTLLKCIRARC